MIPQIAPVIPPKITSFKSDFPKEKFPFKAEKITKAKNVYKSPIKRPFTRPFSLLFFTPKNVPIKTETTLII